MLTLYIEGKKAVLRAGQEISITRANPFLEKQGDYSLDIELPLRGCPQNIAIFGPAHRREAAKQPYAGKRYEARIYAPPLTLRGAAEVTKATESGIAVQFVGGRSEMAGSLKDREGFERYADELEGLGYAWEEQFPDFYDGTWQHIVETEEPLLSYEGVDGLHDYISYRRARGTLADPTQDGWHERVFSGTPQQTRYVAFPVGDGTYTDNLWEPGNMEYYYPEGSETPVPRRPHAAISFLAYSEAGGTGRLAPQPYLFHAVGRILEAIGYTLEGNELEGTWLETLFLASEKETLSLREMLPHMTVADLLEEIEQYLQIYFYISGKKAYIRRNRLNGEPQRIRQIAAEYEATIEEEKDSANALTGNIAYAYDTDLPLPKTLALDERDYKRLVIKAGGKSYNGPDPYPDHLDRMLEILPDGRAQAYLYVGASPYLAEVDQMGILFRDYTRLQADIKFKIQPARGTTYEIKAHFTRETPVSGTEPDPFAPIGPGISVDWDILGQTGAQLAPGKQARQEEENAPAAEEAEAAAAPARQAAEATRTTYVTYTEYLPAIFKASAPKPAPATYHGIASGDDSGEEAKDDGQIYIAANLGKRYALAIFENAYIPFPFCLCQYVPNPSGREVATAESDLIYEETVAPVHTQEFYTRNIGGIAHCPFALRETRSPSIAADAWQKADAIDTRVVHIAQFADPDINLDPTAAYIIRGRRYACKKIELTLTDRGIAPLKTGYFYELTE